MRDDKGGAAITARPPRRPGGRVSGEDADEWDAFRADGVRDLDPATTLERELAVRAALQLWRPAQRLRRPEAKSGSSGTRHGAGAGRSAARAADSVG